MSGSSKPHPDRFAAEAPALEPDLLRGIRVLVLTSGHEAFDGRIFAKEAKSLQAMGAEVTLVAATAKSADPGGIRLLALPTPSSRAARFLLQPWRCLWKARKEQPHIVHFHDAEMLATLPFARLLWRKAKFVYDVHEDFGNLMLVRDWLPAPVKPLVRAATSASELLLARLAHGIVAVTPPLAAKFPHARKVTAFNFLSRGFLEQAGASHKPAKERRFDLVHLGTLNRRRAGFLAEVLREYHALRPKARSVVIGAPPDALESVRDRLPPQCSVVPRVPFSEIPALLSDAKIGIDVHPWLGRHLRPALAVKVCEYMACGCAVVASSMPVLEDLLAPARAEASGIVTIRGEDAGEYAGAAVRLAESIDAGGDPGFPLRALAAQRMSWDTEALKIARLYRSLLDGGPCAT